MRPWTQDVVPAAGVALVCLGAALVKAVDVWGGVACVALGVVLLVALRALEYRAEDEDISRLKAVTVELLRDMKTLQAEHTTTAKNAEAALAAARVNRSTARGLDY